MGESTWSGSSPGGEDPAQLRELAEQAAVTTGDLVHGFRPRLGERHVLGADTTSPGRAAIAIRAGVQQVREVLRRHHRSDVVAGPRDRPSGHSGQPWLWLVDGIDATANYTLGDDQLYCVAVAVQHNGHVVAGAIYQPAMRTVWSAALGQGSTWRGPHGHSERLAVTTTSDLRSVLVAVSEPDGAERPPSDRHTVLLTHTAGIRAFGSPALALCRVAAGQHGVYVADDITPASLAAGGILATEAGACLDRSSPAASLLVGSPRLVAALRAVLERPTAASA